MKYMNELTFILPDLSTELPLDYIDGGIPAGFPSPAQDYVGDKLDLNRELVQHPSATFYARADGNSMEPNIHCGDLLVIDRSMDPTENCVAVCFVNGEFTIKRLDLSQKASGIIRLVPDNPEFPILEVTDQENFEIWGVVRFVIHNV